MKSDICNHASKVVSFECYRWYHLSAMISYALRLVGHQSPRQIVRDGTDWVVYDVNYGEIEKEGILQFSELPKFLEVLKNIA